MSVRLTIWYLRKFACDRGYALNQENWKEYRFYSDKTIKKNYYNGKRNKTGGRMKGTPNKLTKEMRAVLKNIIAEKTETIPLLMNDLEPLEQLELMLKLMLYVVPMVRDISHDNNESNDFWNFD